MRKLQLTLARIRFIPDGGKILGESGCDSPIPGAGMQRGEGAVSRTERGECRGCREGSAGARELHPREKGRCYRLRICGELRQRRRQEPRVGAPGGRRPKREAVREPPVLELPEAQAAVPRVAEGRSIGGGQREGCSVSLGTAALTREAAGTAGQTDRSGGSSEYGMFKDSAQPTGAA